MWRQIQGRRGLFALGAVAALALTGVLARGAGGADNGAGRCAAADRQAVHAQGPKHTRDVVHVTAAAAAPAADGSQAVTLAFKIDKDWHLYANPMQDKDLKLPEDFSGVETTITATISGKPVAIQVGYPEGTLVRNYGGAYRVYEDGIQIRAVAQRVLGDTGPLEIGVRCQACNDVKGTCLSPETIQLTAP